MIRKLSQILWAGLTFAIGPVVAPLPVQADILDDVLDVSVLTGWREADGAHIAGLKVTLAPGWKTYWRAPGDAGIPPRFNWSGSQNLKGLRVHWPVPDVFWQSGLRSVGYADQVILPIVVSPSDPSAPVVLSGAIDLGVCEDICIPVMLQIEASLPPKGAADADLSAAMADRPQTEREARVGAVTCSVRPIDDGLRLTARIEMPAMRGQEAAVVETADATVWSSEPKLTRDGATLQAVTDLVPEAAAPFALDRSGVRITILAGGQAVDIRGCTSN